MSLKENVYAEILPMCQSKISDAAVIHSLYCKMLYCRVTKQH